MRLKLKIKIQCVEFAYLFLLETLANLSFRGNHWVQVDPALRGIPGCLEGLGVRQDRDYCFCSYWGSGSPSYRFCSFVLQAYNIVSMRLTSTIYTNKKTYFLGLLLLTSCSQTCLATERIIFWDAVSPWKTKRQSSGAWSMPKFLLLCYEWLPGHCSSIPETFFYQVLRVVVARKLRVCYGTGCQVVSYLPTLCCLCYSSLQIVVGFLLKCYRFMSAGWKSYSRCDNHLCQSHR